MLQKKIDEGVFLLVNKFAVVVAPFAVVFIEGLVRLSADHGVFGERHSAALAEKLAGRAQQSIYRNVKLA